MLTVAIGIRTNTFRIFGVLAWLAFAGRIICSSATVLGLIVLRACGETRIELRSLKVVIWIWVNTILRLVWNRLLQVPWTPCGDLILIYLLIKRQGIGGICSQKGWILWVWIVTFWRKQTVCALTRRIGGVWRNIDESGVIERLKNNSQGNIVAVDK